MSNLIPYKNTAPEIDESSYINLHSIIIGNVKINKNCTVWPGAILCAFELELTVHDAVVILDKAILTATDNNPLEAEEGALISQSTVLQGCRIGKNALIGRGANICEGAVVGDGAIISPGTLVMPGQEIPLRTLAAEAPAKFIREITEEEYRNVRAKHNELMVKAKEYGSYYNLSLEQ